MNARAPALATGTRRQPGYAAGRTQQRWLGWMITVALHAAALLALLSYAPAREALSLAAPIMVSLILSPSTPPKPEVTPTDLPKPLPMRPKAPPKPMPILTAPADAEPLVTVFEPTATRRGPPPAP